jgi:hypothetical protein
MKLLREPLGQFVALGIVLFVVYALASDLLASDEARRIAITESEIELLATTWERQWQRAPTAKELHALVDSRVREEVLYREALALGLDRNDVVVRRRMVQKMELLSQDLALLADPTDPELQAFFDENREDYRIPPRVSFSHVYFNADRRGEAVLEDAERVLAEIRAQTPQPTAAGPAGVWGTVRPSGVRARAGLARAGPLGLRSASRAPRGEGGEPASGARRRTAACRRGLQPGSQ